MRKLVKNIILLLFVSLVLNSCGKKDPNELSKMHWDRDTCVRCMMVISEKSYAVQVINKKTNTKHKFDDIGCAIVWFKENKHTWLNEAMIFVKDEKSQNWINAKEAFWTEENITPMNYGLAAYTKDTIPENKLTMDFPQVMVEVAKIEELNLQRRAHKRKKSNKKVGQ